MPLRCCDHVSRDAPLARPRSSRRWRNACFHKARIEVHEFLVGIQGSKVQGVVTNV
jgi:hypothetical protein